MLYLLNIIFSFIEIVLLIVFVVYFKTNINLFILAEGENFNVKCEQGISILNIYKEKYTLIDDKGNTVSCNSL